MSLKEMLNCGKKIAIYKVGLVLMDLFKKSLCIYYWKLLHGSRISCLSSVQSLNRVRLSATPWTAEPQASLSITNSWSLLKLMSIESVMPSNHLILCCSLLLLPSIFPTTRVFSNELTTFASDGQSIGTWASALVLPINIQGWFSLGLTG